MLKRNKYLNLYCISLFTRAVLEATYCSHADHALRPQTNVHVLLRCYNVNPMCMRCSREVHAVDVIVGIPLLAIWGRG